MPNGRRKWIVVLNFNRVAAWLPDANEEEIDEIDDWLCELEYGDDPIELRPDDLDAFWDRIVALAGGSLDRSLEIELRMLLGDLAALADGATVGDDIADVVSVEFRSRLKAADRNPSGVWEAALLADLLENAYRAHEVWRRLDPDSATIELVAQVSKIASECEALSKATRSIATRRMLASTSALCAFTLGDTAASIGNVELFFQLEQQTRRESGPVATNEELLGVTLAGVNAYAAQRDGAAVTELMRHVRLLAEPAGELLQPEYMHIWSAALLDLDPPFAQMLAQQMLRDVQETFGPHSDDAMFAAYSLFQSTVVVGDEAAIETLINEWLPIAMESGHGPGGQLWLQSVEVEDPDDV